MKTTHLFLIFLLVVLAQLYIPASMIFQQENIIASGKAYKFKTQPVDPSDPYRGKYIYLNFEMNSLATTDSTWISQEDVFVTFVKDSLGFATAKSISRSNPNSGDYVKVKVDWYNNYEKRVNFSLPFTEFYMNEAKAYDAEVAHRDAQIDTLANTTYALVYLKNGDAVLQNVFINDIPIAEYVEKKQ